MKSYLSVACMAAELLGSLVKERRHFQPQALLQIQFAGLHMEEELVVP